MQACAQGLKSCALRSLALLALGLFLNNGRDLARWRLPGPLQTLAVASMLVQTIVLTAPLPPKRPRASSVSRSHAVRQAEWRW
jgi:hypothetical protein